MVAKLLTRGGEHATDNARNSLRQERKAKRICRSESVFLATEVPSGMRLEFGGGISGNMRLSFQAARSIG